MDNCAKKVIGPAKRNLLRTAQFRPYISSEARAGESGPADVVILYIPQVGAVGT